jgi:hypothetical protein
MGLRTVSRSARLLALAAVCAALLAVGLIWFRAAGAPRAEAVAEAVSQPPAPEMWKTIEYRGVRVDIPSAWERPDTSGCEFRFERWASPDSPRCGGEGVVFYGSATFDPAHGPGVRRTAALWAGYVFAGDYAVYASGSERDLVQRVLDSARATGSRAPGGR